MGAKASKQESSQQATNQGFSQSFVNQAQLPMLQDLWQQGQGVAGSQSGIADSAQRLAGLSQGYMGQGLDALGALTDASGQIRTQTDALKGDLQDLWTNTLMPSMDSNAIASGGFGGGRQGVAQGIAAQGVMDSLSSGVADITGRANQQAMNAAQMMIPGAESFYNAGMAPYQAAWAPLQNLGGILGAPIMESLNMQQGQSSGSSSGSSVGFSIA